MNLSQPSDAKRFYERRYGRHYMDDWPAEKKERVAAIIAELPLPRQGIALDFGCGNGVFTAVLRQALPGWTVQGCDLSETAIAHARERFPECGFFVAGQAAVKPQFDLVFTHHVLEHVADLAAGLGEINSYLAPAAHVLHVCPCGNEQSFEHDVCALRSDGIDAAQEGRFFYEDQGHVRRLTTEQVVGLMQRHRFILVREWYANHYHGAVRWISQNTPFFILRFTNPHRAVDAAAAAELRRIRRSLLWLNFWQLPAVAYQRMRMVHGKGLFHYAVMAASFFPSLVAAPVYNRVNARARREWEEKKHERNGSEMYLFFSRKS